MVTARAFAALTRSLVDLASSRDRPRGRRLAISGRVVAIPRQRAEHFTFRGTQVAIVLQRTEDSLGVVPRPASRKSRIVGVDVARGLALIGMMATHVFPAFDDDGRPTASTLLAGGRAATTFVVVAGVSMAFLSGGHTPFRGHDRTAASAGFAARAVMVGLIGLALGYLGPANGIDGILPLYGLLFLLAIPLVGCSSPMLIVIAATLTAVGPVLIVATADLGLPYSGYADDPTFSTLARDPGGLLFQLGLTGAYPAVIYLAYLCVGLAIGRLDLRSRRVAWWLTGGGLALAVVSRAISAVVLYRLGGLDRLVDQYELRGDPAGVRALLWEPELSGSWWYLGLSAPHSHTPLDMLHTAGSAMAILGLALLVTQLPLIARLSWPLAAAGSMTLTLYSAHLILLAFRVGEGEPLLLFLSMTVGALVLAGVWRWQVGPGPLETVVSEAATSARRAVAGRLRAEPASQALSGSRGTGLSTMERLAIRILALIASAGVLTLALWGGAGSATAGMENPADVAEETVTGALTPEPAAVPPVPAPVQPVGDVRRYCELSDQIDESDEAEASQVSEMTEVAPAEIREAVTVIAHDLSDDADLPGAVAPDEGSLALAEVAVQGFKARSC
jgi:uncharacterized membrane protein